MKISRIKFQWSKEKQNRVRPSAGGRSRRKSHKPNSKLRPERAQHRYNNQENDSISADNAIPSPSYSDAPIQLQSDQKRISRHDEASITIVEILEIRILKHILLIIHHAMIFSSYCFKCTILRQFV